MVDDRNIVSGFASIDAAEQSRHNPHHFSRSFVTTQVGMLGALIAETQWLVISLAMSQPQLTAGPQSAEELTGSGTFHAEVAPAAGSDNAIPTRSNGLRWVYHVFREVSCTRTTSGITQRKPDQPRTAPVYLQASTRREHLGHHHDELASRNTNLRHQTANPIYQLHN